MKDSQWLAHLLRHGVIRASFIPPPEIRQLRDLTRRRKQLVNEGTRERNRIQKILEEGNVKREFISLAQPPRELVAEKSPGANGMGGDTKERFRN